MSDGNLQFIVVRTPSSIPHQMGPGSIAVLLDSELEHQICSPPSKRGLSSHMAEGCPTSLRSKLLTLGEMGEISQIRRPVLSLCR